jgi:hypothetical protein
MKPRIWKKPVCTGIFYGFARQMKLHLVDEETERAICGYKSEYGWEKRDDSPYCKRCLKAADAHLHSY